MIQFILNNKHITTHLPKGTTVLDFVRYHQNLTGTKIGCREGDCGACTVLVGELVDDQLVYLSKTSCLIFGSSARYFIISGLFFISESRSSVEIKVIPFLINLVITYPNILLQVSPMVEPVFFVL